MVEKQFDLISASEILGIPVRTLRDWINKGKIVAKKYSEYNNSKLYISESEIARVQKEMI